MIVAISMRLPSVANLREHWRTKAKRSKAQRYAVHLAMRSMGMMTRDLESCAAVTTRGLPLSVTLTRIAPRPIRDAFENLPMCFKAVVDQLAEELGVDDSELDIQRPKQERGAYAVRIEISAGGAA
jgi:hypothetical protein